METSCPVVRLAGWLGLYLPITHSENDILKKVLYFKSPFISYTTLYYNMSSCSPPETDMNQPTS